MNDLNQKIEFEVYGKDTLKNLPKQFTVIGTNTYSVKRDILKQNSSFNILSIYPTKYAK